jgi:hypothetical protein
MPPQGSDAHDGGQRPGDDGWPDDEWPDGEDPWADDEDTAASFGHGGQAGADGTVGPGGPGRPGRRRRPSPVAVAIVAMLAAAIGFGAAFAAVRAPSAASASGTPSPAPGRGALQTFPPAGGGVPGGLPGGSGQIVQMAVAGRVAAVSTTSITIEAGGGAFTAAVTSATEVTGRVTSVSGIRVGDSVSAEMTGTQSNGTQSKLTATAIQDPAGPAQ